MIPVEVQDYRTSCMYNNSKTGVEHDWMQLGWLIDWVLVNDNHTCRYHERTELHQSLSESSTLQELLRGTVHKIVDCGGP